MPPGSLLIDALLPLGLRKGFDEPDHSVRTAPLHCLVLSFSQCPVPQSVLAPTVRLRFLNSKWLDVMKGTFRTVERHSV